MIAPPQSLKGALTMFSSTLRVVGCLFAVCLSVYAQNPAKQPLASATVSGKITLKGNGIPGILVAARMARSSGRANPPVVASTDQQGNYRISNLAPGSYEIQPAAAQYVVTGSQVMRTLIIAEGESFENVDFALTRGGVITGKITDGDGRPVIEEQIEVFSSEGPNQQMRPMSVFVSPTDDRGIYRVYGLAPGKYKVSAGTSEDRMYFDRRGSIYSQTFHPSTTDVSKATTIEVAEGGEVTNVDITLRRNQATFTVTARVIDAETGKPIPDVRYGLEKMREHGSAANSGMMANRLGEIRIENVTPGKYALFLDGSYATGLDRYAEPVRFEVIDQDVKDLVLKASTASSVSGVVVFEGVDEKVARSKFAGLMVFAHVSVESSSLGGFGGSAPYSRVNEDGSFKVGGIRPGVIQFLVYSPTSGRMPELDITRIERDGVVQSRIEIKEHEQINGLRLVIKPRSGGIRGTLKIENGEGFSMNRVFIYLSKVGAENFGMSLRPDDRGRFVSEGLAAGVYTVRAVAYGLPRREVPTTTQQVVVADGQVTEITLTLNVKPDDDEDDDP